MTDPAQLRRGRAAELPITLVETDDAQVVEAVRDEIAGEFGWPLFSEWGKGFARPGRHHYLIQIGGDTAGLAKLIDNGGGDVEISSSQDHANALPNYLARGFEVISVESVPQ